MLETRPLLPRESGALICYRAPLSRIIFALTSRAADALTWSHHAKEAPEATADKQVKHAETKKSFAKIDRGAHSEVSNHGHRDAQWIPTTASAGSHNVAVPTGGDVPEMTGRGGIPLCTVQRKNRQGVEKTSALGLCLF